jgi:predicted dehydrogenase
MEATGEGHVVAAASRSALRARRFGRAVGLPNVYRSYEEMLERERLDAVYVATLHNFHFENARLCLERGVPVLVEKAFTRNAYEAQQLAHLARHQKLFLMEAMWTRFNPATLEIQRLLRDGAIGQPQTLRAEFCVRMNPLSRKMMPWNRMYNPRLAGGALLDLGVYLLSYARMIFGQNPTQLSGTARNAWTGVDADSEYHLTYPAGRQADLYASFQRLRPRVALLCGTEGTLRVPSFQAATEFTLERPGHPPHTQSCADPGFEHEIREVHRCLREGLLESPAMPLSETVEILQTADALRALWGLQYPGEPTLPPATTTACGTKVKENK